MNRLDLPPVWMVAAMVAMWLAARALPVAEFAPAYPVAGGLIAAAIAVTVWAAIHFRRQRTTVVPHNRPSALVTDGPFRFSRNPIYASDVVILIGWGLILGSVIAFAVIPAFVWIIQRRFIREEEALLKEDFPEAFADWARRTRRWI